MQSKCSECEDVRVVLLLNNTTRTLSKVDLQLENLAKFELVDRVWLHTAYLGIENKNETKAHHECKLFIEFL